MYRHKSITNSIFFRFRTRAQNCSFCKPHAGLRTTWLLRCCHVVCDSVLIGGSCWLETALGHHGARVCVFVQGAREQRVPWENRGRVVVRRDTLRKLCKSACYLDLHFNCMCARQQNSLTGAWPFQGKNLPALFQVIRRAKFKCPSWFVSAVIAKLECPKPSLHVSSLFEG